MWLWDGMAKNPVAILLEMEWTLQESGITLSRYMRRMWYYQTVSFGNGLKRISMNKIE